MTGGARPLHSTTDGRQRPKRAVPKADAAPSTSRKLFRESWVWLTWFEKLIAALIGWVLRDSVRETVSEWGSVRKPAERDFPHMLVGYMRVSSDLRNCCKAIRGVSLPWRPTPTAGVPEALLLRTLRLNLLFPLEWCAGAGAMRVEIFMADTFLRAAVTAVQQGGNALHEALDSLPVPVYTTNAVGIITYYNHACVTFAGRKPRVGQDSWCVTWKLYTDEGELLPPDQCPMAVAIQERRPVRGVEAVAERPDGTRINFLPYPTPLFDENEDLIGAVNMFIDVTARKQTPSFGSCASGPATGRRRCSSSPR